MEFFNRDAVRDLHHRLQETLDRFAQENGLKAIVGSSSFTPYNICFKVEVAVVTQQGDALTREAETFFHHAACFGLAREDLGKTFQYGGHAYKIIGLNTRSRKAPVLATDEDGKRYKFSVELLKAVLSAKNDTSQQPAVHSNLPLEDG
jgi:hypothetical protein